ncbi:hypothetical protein IAT40_003418 [Kwoniella sp. CBS 6097]
MKPKWLGSASTTIQRPFRSVQRSIDSFRAAYALAKQPPAWTLTEDEKDSIGVTWMNKRVPNQCLDTLLKLSAGRPFLLTEEGRTRMRSTRDTLQELLDTGCASQHYYGVLKDQQVKAMTETVRVFDEVATGVYPGMSAPEHDEQLGEITDDGESTHGSTCAAGTESQNYPSPSALEGISRSDTGPSQGTRVGGSAFELSDCHRGTREA